MAVVSELVAAISEVEGIPFATLELLVRHAREAGFVTTGARGRNAPPASVSDAVNILIAANAGGPVVRLAHEAIPIYRQLFSNGGGYRAAEPKGRGVEYLAIEEEPLAFLNEPASLGETMETVLERFGPQTVGDDNLDSYLVKRSLLALPASAHEKSKRDYPDDEMKRYGALVEAAKRALRSGLFVTFELTFHRPCPGAELRVETRGRALAIVDFNLTGEAYEELERTGAHRAWNGDRREAVTIGYRTLTRIGQILATTQHGVE